MDRVHSRSYGSGKISHHQLVGNTLHCVLPWVSYAALAPSCRVQSVRQFSIFVTKGAHIM